MRKSTRRQLVMPAVTLCALLAGAVVAPGVSAAKVSPHPGESGKVPDRRVVDHVRGPVHGRAAVQSLGERLPLAARRNGMSTDRLRELLLEDETAWLDDDAQLYYRDPAATESATASAAAAAPASYPLDQTFRLHSGRGSQRTIYLDFNGHNVSGTYWNRNDGVPAGDKPAWDIDGTPASFSVTELRTIQSVWQRVSEDYAPFDVDVTTEDPGSSALSRTDEADQAYGTRALISPSESAQQRICGMNCGGIAYLDVFDTPIDHPDFQPAWIFPQSLDNDAKNIAEAVSHEVGHNLGLVHDGTPTSDYYNGHGVWAPIMGAGYGRAITQWSAGDYRGATSRQDDLAVIAHNGVTVRSDEAGGAPSQTAVPAGTAYITSDADRDVYALGVCSGVLTLAAEPAAQSPDLDIKLSLLDVTGGAVVADNPTSRAGTPAWDVATGLAASVSRTVAESWYFVAVEGVGNGSPSKGYDGYASVGAYALDVTGTCQSPSTEVPSAPQTVQASADGRTATVQWAAPASSGTGGSITQYVVTRGAAAPVTVSAQSRAYTFTGLEPGANDTVAVQAVNDAGEGVPAAVVVKVPATKPGRARIRSASSGATGGKVTALARWDAPTSTGGAKVDGYRVWGYRLNDKGRVVQSVRSSVRSPSTRSWQATLPRGRWKFAVKARNSVGWAVISARSNTVTAR
jgi:Fibronectin type III domain